VANTEYYDLLGVSQSANSDEIKKAFRQKARSCHPDVSDAPDAEEQFKKLNEAYDVLSDPRKRSQYDQFGSVGNTGGFGGSGGYQYVDINDLFGAGGVDLGDLFSSFFMGGSRRGGGHAMRREGRDTAMQIGITLEEAAQGITREIIVDRLAPCEDCSATGSAEEIGTTTCPDCQGTGQKTTYQRTFLGTMQASMPCSKCQGTGSFIPNPCPECEGSGRVIDRQQAEVSIPAGISDGQHLRMPNLGEAGIRGAASGDLILTIRVAPDKRFERRGSDLHMLLPLTFTQAALGATKRIQGLLDEVVIEVPAGIQTGETVKVVGAGMPSLHGETFGNLICHIEVVVPRKLTAKQKELIQKLSTEFEDSETSQVEHHRTRFEKVKDRFIK